ncbi:MAG: deoxyribonuclease IV [Tenericutes bacterium GWC2_34_14]|nr:MAG: deoxyribonuclease IV [Tenericutes bacterium GWC2_34_14]OHE34423.1 MAG: deoxyribonuclease IV [Tenericutes bacterium GWE2_34_108]OHE35779.1 MAG: deoxyribonuclease IV [Tenericutes bacterium GWF1_35_14]OHE39134.1 MAG: deoxyribonuclease IV [Tenericutes bacterium GWF2_35_184]OHE42380.1 MAG: deoxyribonuclease IV [Tenericutes bacterium RIFOXYA12_FULL_35_10]OHE42799.1 MAG: deoxyribonuclease IV [Tenericutes bacterium RIFOXYA2_FULL_36_32]OHE46027.1 MAG: deoxyribonuclease IV [Tenericutes bacteriu
MPIKIGSHVSMSGDKMYLASIEEALSYEANALMIYTGAPQNTIRKKIEDLNIENAIILMEEKGLSFDDVIVHAPYIINLANPDPVKRGFAIDFLSEEVRRTNAMHVKQIVLHPGSAVAGDREQAVKWIAEGVNEVISRTKGLPVKIALETMAGKGNEVGKTFEELRAIIDLIDDKSRVSVCFDTCHTHDAGYDVKEDFDGVMKHFDHVVGKDKISVFHVNDSKNIKGAAKDRHENFGFGFLGFDALIKVIYHPDFLSIPKILETPYVDDNPPYKEEIKMIRLKTFDSELVEKLKQK